MTDLSALKKELDSKRKNLQGKSFANMWRPESGKNVVRIFPRWDKPEVVDPNFYQPFAQHFVKSKEGKTVAIYMCNEQSLGEPCPVCETLNDAMDMIASKYGVSAADIRRGLYNKEERVTVSSEDEQLIKIIHDARAVKRALFNGIVVGDEDDKPRLLSLPASVADQILQLVGQLAADEGVWALDPKEGHDFVISREGAGVMNTKYSVSYSLKPRAIDSDLLAASIDLEDYVRSEASPANQSRALRAIEKITGVEAIPALTVGADKVAVLEAPSKAKASEPLSSVKADISEPMTASIEVEDIDEASVDMDDDLQEFLNDLD